MELKDPPFSTADLGRAPDDIAKAGEKWRSLPDDFLVGVCGRESSTEYQHVLDGARVELARRGVDAQRALQGAIRESIAEQQRLVGAIDAASDCAMKQTAEVINLTRALKAYTIVLAAIGLVQILLMVWK